MLLLDAVVLISFFELLLGNISSRCGSGSSKTICSGDLKNVGMLKEECPTSLTLPLSLFAKCLGARTKYVLMPLSSRYSHLSPPLPGSSSNSPCRLSLVVCEICTLLDRPETRLKYKTCIE